MKWLTENWSLLVVIACFIGVAIFYARKFTKLPSDEQMTKVKEWLLWAVIATEKELGAGTGQAKLRYCYSLFIDKFPALVTVISFELFSKLVDEALERMKKLLETNKDIEVYIKGD